MITGSTSGVAGFRYSSVSASRDYNSNAYSSGPTNPFGSVSTDNEQMSLYATYGELSLRALRPSRRPERRVRMRIDGDGRSNACRRPRHGHRERTMPDGICQPPGKTPRGDARQAPGAFLVGAVDHHRMARAWK